MFRPVLPFQMSADISSGYRITDEKKKEKSVINNDDSAIVYYLARTIHSNDDRIASYTRTRGSRLSTGRQSTRRRTVRRGPRRKSDLGLGSFVNGRARARARTFRATRSADLFCRTTPVNYKPRAHAQYTT